MLDSDSFIIILYALPVYQLLFYTIQLITFKKTNHSRKYFGVLMLCMTVLLFLNAYLRFETEMNLIFIFIIPVGLLIPPFLYRYILSLLDLQDQRNILIANVLFVPAIVILLLNVIGFESSLAVQRNIFFSAWFDSFANYLSGDHLLHKLILFGLLLIIVGLAVYSIARFLVLMRTGKVLLHEQTRRFAPLQLKWVKIIISCVLIFFAFSLMQFFVIGTPNLLSSLLFNVIVLFSGGLAGYYGMKQNTLMIEASEVGSRKSIPVARDEVTRNQVSSNKYSGNEVSEIVKKIEHYMQHEKPFLIKRYSINDLCVQTNLKRHQVTTVLNEEMGTNFNGYINEYRIREAIRILETDNKNYTIDAIADMAGFHSRSSFYACFKSYTGQSPKEYLLNNKKQ